jgi:hypothetical protein
MPARPSPTLVRLAAVGLLVGSPALAAAGRPVLVTTSADAGPGSFRAAIDRANGDPGIDAIVFTGRARAIALKSTVVFSGPQALTLDLANVVLDGAGIGAGPALLLTGGGHLTVLGMTVRNAPADGIEIQVPPTATGTLRLHLAGVTIAGNRGHGVLVNDQLDPTTTDGVPPDPRGSAASIAVSLLNTRFSGNGFSVSDRDGLRVNEGGDGDLTFVGRLVAAEGNAADGIELDERGPGDVRLDVWGARVDRNGVFDPSDYDDGFDIDESGDGSILGTVAFTTANDNYEEGLDFNENDAGDLRVDLAFVEASGNAEEGIDYEEDDDFAGGGDLVTTMVGVRANRNTSGGGDGGVKIREKGSGSLQARLSGIEASENTGAGISIREDAGGHLGAEIVRAATRANGSHGIDLDENRASAGDAGDLAAAIADSESRDNVGAGVRADQQTPGAGTLTLRRVALANNAGGPTAGSGVTVTVVP